MQYVFIILSLLVFPDVVLAESSTPFFSKDMMAKVVGFMLSAQVILFGLGKALTEISVYTDNKWDNMAAKWLSKAAWFIGSMVSKFGYGQPKQVTLKESQKILSKP